MLFAQYCVENNLSYQSQISISLRNVNIIVSHLPYQLDTLKIVAKQVIEGHHNIDELRKLPRLIKDSYGESFVHIRYAEHTYPDFDFIYLNNGAILGIDSEQLCIYADEGGLSENDPIKTIYWKEDC